MPIQTLTQPIINPIAAFDATEENVIEFTVIGGAQVVGNRLLVRDNQTGDEVYNQTQSTMQLKHTIPAGTLTNGSYYSAVVYTLNNAGTESQASTAVSFYCYSTPDLTITNIPATETVENSTYTFIGNYSQLEGELLDFYQFTLYDSNKEILTQSPLIYYASDSSLSYTFVGMSNDTSYYVELSGETVNNTEITTGLLYFTVRYLSPASFAIVDLVNNCEDGYIQISSNIKVIDGKSNPSPPTYIDNTEVDLTGDNTWVNWDSGFTIADDFTMRIWGRNFNEDEIIVQMVNSENTEATPNKIEMKWMTAIGEEEVPTYNTANGIEEEVTDSKVSNISSLNIKGRSVQRLPSLDQPQTIYSTGDLENGVYNINPTIANNNLFNDVLYTNTTNCTLSVEDGTYNCVVTNAGEDSNFTIGIRNILEPENQYAISYFSLGSFKNFSLYTTTKGGNEKISELEVTNNLFTAPNNDVDLQLVFNADSSTAGNTFQIWNIQLEKGVRTNYVSPQLNYVSISLDEPLRGTGSNSDSILQTSKNLLNPGTASAVVEGEAIYYLSSSTNSSTTNYVYLWFYDEDNNLLDYSSEQQYDKIESGAFTTPAKCVKVVVTVTEDATANDITADQITGWQMMIVKNESGIAYTPYIIQPSVVRYFETRTLDGSEGWELFETGTATITFKLEDRQYYNDTYGLSSGVVNCISDKLPGYSYDYLHNNDIEGIFQDANYIYVKVNQSRDISNLNTFQAFLSSNNISGIFRIYSPIIESLSDENVKKLNALTTYSGVSNIYTNNSAPAVLETKYQNGTTTSEIDKVYVILRCWNNHTIPYICHSNYIEKPKDTDKIFIWVRRNNNLFDIKIENLYDYNEEKPSEKSKPVVTLTIDETTATTITVTAHSIDDSGLRTLKFSKNNGVSWDATIDIDGLSSTNSYTFTGLTPNTNYTIRAEATDIWDNVGYIAIQTKTDKTSSTLLPNNTSTSFLKNNNATSFARATSIQYNSAKADSSITINTISTDASEYPVYGWVDSNKAGYWYSEAERVYLNEDSSNMFNGYGTLTSINLTGFDSSNVVNASNMFQDLEGLTTLNLYSLDTSNVTNMSNMFAGIPVIPDTSNFNTSNVTNMSGMFSGLQTGGSYSMTLSNFDTSKVTDMSSMFQSNTYLSSVSLTSFNTINVTDMSDMFNGCPRLASFNLSSFDTSNVTDMSRMFRNCFNYSDNSLDLSNFKTPHLTNMSNMFYNCGGLTSVDLSKFDTSNVTNMEAVFSSCTSLTSITGLSNFNTSNVTTMQNMFTSCGALTSIDVSNFNTENVTTLKSMFSSCKVVTTLDISNFSTPNVTDMASMFFGCVALTTIYATDKFVITKVTSSTEMFYDCTSLVGGAGTHYNENNVEAGYAHIDSTSNPGYFTAKS